MKYCGFCLLAVVCLASTIRGEAAGPQNSLRIAVYESEANAAEYRGVHQSPLRAWLQRNHDDFEVIGDHTASDPVELGRFAAAISTSNYIVPDTAAAGLAAFVKAGGRLLWIDGPARCQNRELLSVLGIEAAHLDMYDFLIWHAPTDWDDFQVFLAEAHRRRLKVWVTLVPPSEPPASAPFGLDYARWADETAD